MTVQGKLQWQDRLSSLNKPFFDLCDGMFLNYTWKYLYPFESAAGATISSTDFHTSPLIVRERPLVADNHLTDSHTSTKVDSPSSQNPCNSTDVSTDASQTTAIDSNMLMLAFLAFLDRAL